MSAASAAATQPCCCSPGSRPATELGQRGARPRPHARVCSYARPGTGTSDPAVSTPVVHPAGGATERIAHRDGEPGPYVVVGRSFGGAEAVTFASRYADQVTGLVLIDASPASWPTELSAVGDDGSGMAATIHSTCAGWTDPTANVEHLDVFGSFTEDCRDRLARLTADDRDHRCRPAVRRTSAPRSWTA